MNIKELSQITGLSAHTLRYYEKLKLICHIKRDSRWYRNYSQEHVERIDFGSILYIYLIKQPPCRQRFSVNHQKA